MKIAIKSVLNNNAFGLNWFFFIKLNKCVKNMTVPLSDE